MEAKNGKEKVGYTTVVNRFLMLYSPRDLDEIDADLAEDKIEKLLTQKIDYDKTGLGQFYCIHCAKDFIDTNAFRAHVKSKPHKRRLHALKTEPYTLEEAERASGMGSYVQPGKRKMETLVPAAVLAEESLADVKKRARIEAEEVDIKNDEDVEGDVQM